jgi:WD40 repeat protein
VLPDGTTIAGDDGDHVDLVDVNSGTVLGAPFPSIGSPAGAVVVSPDGRVLATAPTIRTGKVVVFDVASRAQIAAITLPAGAVPTEFLPDGRLVITVGGQVVVWRPGVTVPPLGVTLGAPDGPVYAVFSEDGRTVATFHSQYGDPTDHPVYAFDGLTGAPMGRIADGQDQHNEIDPNPVALSPDGKVVAIAARDGAVHLRDATTGDDIGVLDVRRPGGELGVVWSPTGNRIATIGVDQAATLWDVSDLHHPKRTGPPLAMPGTPAINPANLLAEFSRDGRSLLVTDAPHGTMTLFDVDTGAPKWSNAFAVFPFAGRLGYTAQNELFVTSGGSLDDLETGRTISLLDPATGRPNATFAPREAGGATDYARNGDLIVVAGTTVATGDNPSTVVIRLYDAASGALLGEPLPVGPVPADPIEKETYIQVSLAALVSPDGERVVTAPAGPGQSVVLWDVDLTDWEATACRIAGRNLTQAEWQQYLAGQPYHVTCPQWPAGT